MKQENRNVKSKEEIYPQMVQRICQSVGEYKNGEISLDSLRDILWEGAKTLSSPQVREERRFLQHAEGRLDQLVFMTEGDEFESEISKVLDEIETRFCPQSE
jgi:hypothetical protein